MAESKFQADLVKKLNRLFPRCVILKNDSGYRQGVPDLIILHRDRWAMLECKRSRNAAQQPNQDYYVEQLGEMSFAAFIYPENEDEVLHDLQRAFSIQRNARVSKR